jgi:hypothetical protein
MGTDDFVKVHVTRERPGGVDDYGWVHLVAAPGALSWVAPGKMIMTVFNKADKQASIQVEHAVNGVGKPGVVAKSSNGFCTFTPARECDTNQKVVCNDGSCVCQTVGEAGGWYTWDLDGGSVSVMLAGMVLVDGPLPVGDTVALVTIGRIGVVMLVANGPQLFQSFASAVGGKVVSVFDSTLARTASEALKEEMENVSNESQACQSCVERCIVNSGFEDSEYGKGANDCAASQCRHECV